MNKYKKFSDQAQKERRKRKSCTNKAAFDTEEAAYQKGQDYYQCKYCGKYHRTGQLRTMINELVDTDN